MGGNKTSSHLSCTISVLSQCLSFFLDFTSILPRKEKLFLCAYNGACERSLWTGFCICFNSLVRLCLLHDEAEQKSRVGKNQQHEWGETRKACEGQQKKMALITFRIFLTFLLTIRMRLRGRD
ncbi:hypothetical protein BU24DRAFT_22303 [Aaosphaeria arxii CBS 175.79]|uniref:Uncharacterized protein n=1 Tax=Aaosphaeria arxii CBS 175.79 TaxID=1450172 RepID=A0A6A5Y953_9PLEO|nr:uncharacterized protein BU24DRAFT_22303 [Aaosphaeria arxii CBS 175.79]KAF2021537.1 hypothetical protein BU24DRAFT_22303 [Aaosphaeria arxii CBS 175.79]